MARALIVDDDSSFGRGLADILRLEGFVTVATSSVREARRELETGTVDIAFVDERLADGSGLELLPGPDAPTVIVTDRPSLALADEVLSLGARDCLAKPVDRVRVRMTLASLARERRMQEEIGRLRTRLAALESRGLRERD
jgi:two-component system NtrC family response regulator